MNNGLSRYMWAVSFWASRVVSTEKALALPSGKIGGRLAYGGRRLGCRRLLQFQLRFPLARVGRVNEGLTLRH